MTLLLIVSMLSVALPSVDGAIVVLPGIPVQPWESLSNLQLEEMWTYGIQGYQVTRSGWSGYILRGPAGSALVLQELVETLEADSTMPDSSLWARTLQLTWAGNEQAASWVLGDSVVEPPVVPVRTSRWLETGADTLILSLPIANSVFLWGGSREGEFNLSAWRGIGTEVIPCGSFFVNALVTSSLEGSPGDIISLEYRPLDLDTYWAENWAFLIDAADSLVAMQLADTVLSVNSLLWIRGTGGETMSPWTMIPSPSPSVVASEEVDRIPGVIPSVSCASVPGMLTVDMPGNAGSGARAAYAAALLERIVSRMALPAGSTCRGISHEDGLVQLCIYGVDWTAETALLAIKDQLTPVIFTSPESRLLNNAAIRAGIPQMDQRDTIELLATVAGFMN